MKKNLTSRKVLSVAAVAALGLSLMTVTTSAAASKDATWNCKPTKAKPVKIRVIEYFAGPARTPLLNAFARQFESTRPGVKVEIISPSQADSPAKITQLLQAKAVDIVEPAGAIMGQALSANQLADIYPYFTKTKAWAGLTEYSQLQAQINKGKGKMYMVPNGYYVKASFVRTEPFKNAGVAIPVTWTDILNAKKAQTDKSYVYSMRGARASFTQAIFVIRAYNAPDLNSGGYYNKDGKSMFNNPKSKEALDLLMKIIADGPTSRVYRKLVVEDQVASSAGGSYMGASLDEGKLSFYAVASDRNSLDKIEASLDSVISDVLTNGVTNAELQRAKNSYIAEYIYENDNQATLARRYGWELSLGRSVKQIESWPDTISKVSLDDIKKAATFLDARRSVTGELLPINKPLATKGETSTSRDRS